MLHQHRTGIGSRQGNGERFDRGIGCREISIGIRSTENLLLSRCRFTPFFGFVIAALLQGDSRLQLKQREVSHFSFHRQSQHFRSRTIATFFNQNPVPLSDVLENKHIRQLSIETFYQEVHLKSTEAVIHIRRSTETLRLLFFEILGALNHRHRSAHILNMQVFIKSLGGTESGRIAQTEVDVLCRIETQIGTGTEDDMVDQIMLVQTSAQQDTPLFIFPFVLEESATNIHRLPGIAIVSPHIILQIVPVIFQPGSQIGRHKEAFIETVHILGTADKGQVRRLSIGIQVLFTTVIAVAVRMLCRCIQCQAVLFVRSKIVELQSPTIDGMLNLLGNIGFVRRTVQHVAATAELLQVMILKR